MNDDELNALIDQYVLHLKCDRGMLGMLCREVERTTRNRAVDALYAVATALNDRVPVRRKLDAIDCSKEARVLQELKARMERALASDSKVLWLSEDDQQDSDSTRSWLEAIASLERELK